MASSSNCYVIEYDTIDGLVFASAPPPLATAAEVAAIKNRSPGRSPLRTSHRPPCCSPLPAKPHALTRKRSADNDGNDEAGNLPALESLDPMLEDPEIEPSCECCGGHIDCPNLQMCECRGHPYCCDSCTVPAPDKNDPDRYCFLCVPLLGYTSDFDRCLACLELEEPFAPLHVDGHLLEPLPVYVAHMALKLLENPDELPDIHIWEHKTSVWYNGEDKEYIHGINDALGDTIALFRTKNPNPHAPFLHDFTILIDCSSAIQQWSPTVTCTQNLKFQARRDERGFYILIEESVVPPQDLKKLVDFFGRTAPAPALKRPLPLTSSSDENRIAKRARRQASPSSSESSRSLRNLTFDLPFGMTLTAPPESHALLHYMCEEVITKIRENSA